MENWLREFFISMSLNTVSAFNLLTDTLEVA